MSIKNTLYIILSLLLTAVFTSFILLFFILKTEDQVIQSEQLRAKALFLADSVRQSSDNLTTMARNYTVTGEPRYRKYFNQIIDIRNGSIPRPDNYDNFYWHFVVATGFDPEAQSSSQTHILKEELYKKAISLNSLIAGLNLTEAEAALLRKSKFNSDTLIHIENQAMNAIVGLYPDENGNYIIKGKPDFKLARNLMHSEEYHRAKAEIMDPIYEFFKKISKRTQEQLNLYHTRGRRLKLILMIILISSVFLISLSVFFIYNQFKQSKKSELTKKKSKINFFSVALPPLGTATLASVLICSSAWWFLEETKGQFYKNTKYEIESILNGTYKSLMDFFENLEDEVKSIKEILSNEKIPDLLMVKKYPLVRSRSLKILKPFIIEKGYENFFILNSSGKVVSSSSSQLIGTHLQKEIPEYFIKQIKQPPKYRAILMPYKSKSQEAKNLFFKSLLIGTGLFNNQKKNIGFLIVELKTQKKFSEILHRGLIGETGESYAFNHLGQMLSESRFNYQLKKMGLFPKEEEYLEVRLPLEKYSKNSVTRTHEDQPLTLMAKQATRGINGISLEPYKDYRGIPVVGAWVWNELYKLGVTTEMDFKEAFASLTSYKKQTFFGVSLTLILIYFLTGFFIWSRIKTTTINNELQSAYTIIKKHSDRMKEELDVGYKIQMSMLPVKFPSRKELSLFAHVKPAQEVGGDYYDFLMINKNKLYFSIGDVSGKGVPSALFMAITKTLIKSNLQHNHNPNDIVSNVNEEIARDNPSCMFVTLVVCILDLKTGEMSFTNAGHNFPYIKKKDGSIITLTQTHGPAVGVISNNTYYQDIIKLEKEDVLFLYTDGITESFNTDKVLFGEEQLLKTLKDTSTDDITDFSHFVLNKVSSFSKGMIQHDDITLLSLKYHGIG